MPETTGERYHRTVLGTVCVPWRDNGEFDEPLFRRTATNLVGAGLRDLYVFGTAGEGYAVTDTQFRRIAKVFAETMAEAGGAPPMVGVISLSLATMRERIAFCRDLGITTFQFALPGWSIVSDVELGTVFDSICGAYPDCRFLHYNLMRSGRLVRPADYVTLAAAHPNFVGTKYGGGDPHLIAGLMAQVPHLRHFFTEQGFYIGAPLGPCALLASIASTNPARAHAYLAAGADGDAARLAALYHELCGMLDALLGIAGTALVDGAYDKLLHRMAEPDFPLRLLPPYVSSTEAMADAYRSALAARFPDWLPSR